MKRAFLAAALCAAIAVGVAAASGGPSLLHPSSLRLKAPATFKAKFKTTKGTFVVTVHRSWAPKGADRFYNLVYYHFYDNQPLFRVDPGFVVQWGISMTPKIAKAWQYANIRDDPVTHKNLKGTITFAISGKNSRTTQVFVNLTSNNFGKSPFAPFGTITSGFSVFTHLYHGYGDGPTQAQAYLTDYGAKWVHKNYPKLDWITTARIVP
jgi:peptidyl-prolyl cis-trans isomerase A (cyclophilin A)